MSGNVVTMNSAPDQDHAAKGRSDYLAGVRDDALYDCLEGKGAAYRRGWQAGRLVDPGPDRPAGGVWPDGRPWRPGEAETPVQAEKVAPRPNSSQPRAIQRPVEQPEPPKKPEAARAAPRIEQPELF